MMITELSRLKLNTQSALLGKVTKNLRAVCVDLNGNDIEVIFYYDKGITPTENDLAEQAIHEIKNYYVNKDIQIEFMSQILQLDYPNKMPLHGHWVFYRSEDSSLYR